MQGATSGTLTSLMANIANTIHYSAAGLLTATASRSFHNAAKTGEHPPASREDVSKSNSAHGIGGDILNAGTPTATASDSASADRAANVIAPGGAARRPNKNALPSVMMAVTRLSTVVSQFSSMALATAAVTLISAATAWPPLQLFAGTAVAAVMLVRAVAGMMLVTDRGSAHTIVSAAAAVQSKSPRAPPPPHPHTTRSPHCMSLGLRP